MMHPVPCHAASGPVNLYHAVVAHAHAYHFLTCPQLKTNLGLCGRPSDYQHWGQILGRNPDKSLKSFLLGIHSHLYWFAVRFLFLQSHASSYSFCKGERRKTAGKPYFHPYGLRNQYGNLKSENSQDYAQKPPWNCLSYISHYGGL